MKDSKDFCKYTIRKRKTRHTEGLLLNGWDNLIMRVIEKVEIFSLPQFLLARAALRPSIFLFSARQFREEK